MSNFSEVLILLTVLVVSDFVAVRVLVFTTLVLVLDGRWRISDIFNNFIFYSFLKKVFLRSEVNQIRKLVLSNLEQTNRQINWPIRNSIASEIAVIGTFEVYRTDSILKNRTDAKFKMKIIQSLEVLLQNIFWFQALIQKDDQQKFLAVALF